MKIHWGDQGLGQDTIQNRKRNGIQNKIEKEWTQVKEEYL
jgi:hypothetical protein